MAGTPLTRRLGRRVRLLRLAKGMTQEDMAKFGFDVKYYQRIEHGDKNLTLKTLERIAKAFDVTVKDLFDR